MSASLDGGRGELRRLLDRFTNADIGSTATDVAGHRIVDIGIARVRIGRQQRGCGHVLAGLAIATLNDFEIEPRLLNLLTRRRIPDSFDRGDRGTADTIDRRDTGAGRRPVQMNRAGAAEGHAAAELGAGHAEHVAKHPQKRGITVDIDGAIYTVYPDLECHAHLLEVASGCRRASLPWG